MVGKRPAFQFYPADWKADDALMSCSAAAQGLWIYMLCVMHYSDPYGHLVTRGGEAMPSKQLAKLARLTWEQVDELLDELADARVFSMTAQGVIFSRRMVADYEVYLERSSSGRRGGRSSRQATASTIVEAIDKQQLPQENNSSSSSSSSTSSSSSQEEHVQIPFAEIWKLVPTGRKLAKVKAQELWEGKDRTTTGEKLSAEDQHLIMERYPFHVAMWKKEATPKDKIPHLRTWIYQRRWVDEIESAPQIDEDEWMYGTVRLADFQKHKDDPDWACYADWATIHDPCTAPTFDEFKKGESS